MQICEAAHVVPLQVLSKQEPEMQLCVAVQAVPQAPQCVAEVMRSAHSLPQTVWPVVHVGI
jgi:hypothetical protein